MSDWKTLPAGRALDRVIAERVGQPLLIYCGGVLINEDTIPAYSASVDVALTLPLPTARYEWHLHGNEGYTCEIWDGGWHEATAKADTPALAICRAWLAWHEAKGE